MQRTGNRWDQASCAYLLARLHRVQDNHDAAATLLRACLAFAPGEELQDEVLQRTEFVLLCSQLRQAEEARSHLERCQVIIANGEDWRGLVGRVALAEAVCCAIEARYNSAEAAFEQAVTVFHRMRLPWEAAEALHCWAQALEDAHQPAQAQARRGRALGGAGAVRGAAGGQRRAGELDLPRWPLRTRSRGAVPRGRGQEQP
jgi:hypothetical protein